jgi:hypothetical protein
MHNSRKITAAVAATLVAGAAAAAAVSPTWSRTTAASSQSLTLVGRETAAAMLALGTPESPVGNQFVTAQRLLVQGRAVGQGGGTCQIVAPAPGRDRYTFHCTMTLRLPAGQIALDGLATFGERGPQPMTMAITGGTGSYRTARGQATVEDRGDGETRYRLSIRR